MAFLVGSTEPILKFFVGAGLSQSGIIFCRGRIYIERATLLTLSLPSRKGKTAFADIS